MKTFLAEFREFISRGNVVDMAIGVIIGAAFGKIVTSLVDNIIMPLVGMICGGVDVSGLAVTVGGATLQYGIFLQNIIDFLIVALVIFLAVRAANKFRAKLIKAKKNDEEVEAEPVETQLEVLQSIRDMLKEK